MKHINIDNDYAYIEDILRNKGWIDDEVVEHIASPGAGNMNVVIRVKTNTRSFILKQSRPFVARYPDIPAPIDRINTEYQFYKFTEGPTIQSHLPKVLEYDSEDYLMMLEDLGSCQDMTSLYDHRSIDDKTLSLLVQIIKLIHSKKISSDYPLNLELRNLNHQHIFVLPFMIDNGFQLDDIQNGLQDLSLIYKTDEHLKKEVHRLGNYYLDQGKTLLHGDYYPGSWLRGNNSIYIIDPEFSFVGFREFDLGVMIAHLIITTADKSYLEKVIELYNTEVDSKLTSQIAGVEIMRRLIGLAQLPLKRSLDEKQLLLSIAHSMILES